jgi:hypothetical protein
VRDPLRCIIGEVDPETVCPALRVPDRWSASTNGQHCVRSSSAR